jgi:uncharacterized protein (DUF1330 family)
MSAYILMKITVTDAEKLKSYQQIAPSIIDKYNGKLLVRGGEVISLEGMNEQRRVVIVEFDSMSEAKAFYYSDEYARAIKLRLGAAEFEMQAIGGLS